MINILSSLVLFSAVLVLTLLERRYINNLFTPFTVTAWPLVLISILTNFFAGYWGFYQVSTRVNLFLLSILLLIWFTGFIIFFGTGVSAPKTNFNQLFSRYRSFRFLILFLSWIIIIFTAIKIYSNLSAEGIYYLADQEFEDKMSRGIGAHLIHFGIVLFIIHALTIWNHKKTILDYLTIICLGISILSIMIKYPIIWSILIVFFIKNFNISPKLQLKKVFTTTFLVTLLFLTNILILFSVWGTFARGKIKALGLLVGWFFNYVLSGPILLDRWLEYSFSQPWWALNIVFINFYNVINGNPERLIFVKYVSPGFMPVSTDFYSNVGTSFGVYYIIGGFTFTFLMTIILAIISYSLLYKSFSSSNPVIIFLTSLFLLLGFFSFFGQYFTVISLYEITIFYVLFIGIMEIILMGKQEYS